MDRDVYVPVRGDLSAVGLRRPAVRVWAGFGRAAGSAWREPLFRIRQIHGNPAFLKITTTVLVILFTRLGGINDNLTDIRFSPYRDIQLGTRRSSANL